MILSKILPYRLKVYLTYFLSKKEYNFNIKDLNKPKIIVALGADYGNLGDCAITYAQMKWLKRNFPEYEIIEFPISKTYSGMKSLKKVCRINDIITIVGGGNTGDLYWDIELCRQFIIKMFPKNKIISFPQTIDFSETKKGKKFLRKTVKVYAHHHDLTLCAREEYSYKFYKQYFTENRVMLVPDIVLTLNETIPQYKRSGITICMRNDRESFISDKEKSMLIKKLSLKYKISCYDTHIGNVTLDEKKRKDELNKIWTAFKQSECVITDRLHGMIFCAITGTPCIVLPNNNRKIDGVYK